MSDKKSIALSKAAEGVDIRTVHKPELLCPAGSSAAFDAAIEAGADAIYIGGSSFNARINAKNFTTEEMREAILRAHCYGVKVYIAANTLIYDRERDDYLRAAEEAYLSGADALIVADLGAASLIRKHIPDIELHASTQLSGHNVSAAKRLAELGFSRMVCAREMSAQDLRTFCAESPIEAEVFVHGALCVCHSGQCLFSSLVGGRSGNRGECAQPCRLPYKVGKGRNEYPLSLRDLCLAGHIGELCKMGVASFKIEGRMKSPEYVRDVGRIWRRLIDEGRNAESEDIRELERIFSRGGFTDGYYTSRIDKSMMGVRSEGDKQTSRELEPFDKITRKVPIDMSASIKSGEPISLSCERYGVTVYGDVPEAARTAPIDEETVRRSFSKLGSTPFVMTRLKLSLDSGLMVPISSLNALRREAVDMIIEEMTSLRTLDVEALENQSEMPKGKRESVRTAVFYDEMSLTQTAKDYFDLIYLPLHRFGGETEGVLLPSVIYDSEREEIKQMLARARTLGAKHALLGNVGHLDLVLEAGLVPHGNIGLNVTNRGTMAALEELGFADAVMSPELSLAKMRDIGGKSAALVYGRVPLMVTEKCVGKEISDCKKCQNGEVTLTDRKNIEFPVLCDNAHRSLIFNSLPTFMADRQNDLERAGLSMRHFIFTVESADEVDSVINMYINKLAPVKPVRRI